MSPVLLRLMLERILGREKERGGEHPWQETTLRDFGTYLAEERHASQNTICSYLRDVTQFSAYLREHQSCTLRQAGGEMIQDYMSWMRGAGGSPPPR